MTRRVPMLIRVVIALGLTQIIGWGTLYYSIAVLAAPMAQSLQCEIDWVFGAFSFALLVSGFSARLAGHAIDHFGGRAVLCFGSAVAALALLIIAASEHLFIFYLGWSLAGLAMSACLYDAAFPALSQLAAHHYRTALTALTLFGGLASTVFWPAAWALQSTLGWRQAALAFAALNLLLCFPLHRWALPASRGLAPVQDVGIWLKTQMRQFARHSAGMFGPAQAQRAVLLAEQCEHQQRSLAWLRISFTLNAFMFSAIGAHIVATLALASSSREAAVWIAALIGPMQVAGRIMEFVFARRVAAHKVGLAAFAMAVVGMGLLWQAERAVWLPYLFAIVYGAANGITTIVRGMVPAELYGRDHYGKLMGHIARPSFFAKAIAPVLIASLITAGISLNTISLALVLLTLLALAAYLLALRYHRLALPPVYARG